MRCDVFVVHPVRRKMSVRIAIDKDLTGFENLSGLEVARVFI